jgi:tRNA pseudouridine55 synthase
MGFLVVDKPVGWTSHDVVDAARRWLGTRRVGHLGTLDPLATGVLPLAIREATKLVPFVGQGDKVYVGTIRLGVATETYDGEGRVTREHDGPLPSEATVQAALAAFVGEIEQIPPMYSSVKRHGVPLYRLARRGEEVERAPRAVRIHEIRMHPYAPPEIGIEVRCSPGTYVRTLAHDLGQRLGCGAHLSGLRRTYSHPFALAQARSPEECDALAAAGTLATALVAPEEALGLPRVRLTAEARGDLERGPLPKPGDRVSVLAPDGTLAAVMELRADRLLHPLRVLAGA